MQSSFKTGRRDFIYVKDLSEAILIAAESKKTGKGEILNIGSGKATTVEDVARPLGVKLPLYQDENLKLRHTLLT